MPYVMMDFETLSACDLKRAGAFTYSEHPSTEVICLGYKIDGGDTKLWKPGDPVPQDLFDAIAAGYLIIAHNVLFERCIWRHIMVAQWAWPEIDDAQWYDTMASCARKSLPLDLDKACRVLRLNYQKNSEGHQAMLKICKPMGKKMEFNKDPVLYQTTFDYCLEDVDAEDALLHCVGTLTPSEMEIWRLNQKMNLRGIRIDMEFAADCQRIVDQAMPELKAEFEELVGCKAGSHVKVRSWVNEKCAPHDIEFEDLTRENVEDALENMDLPEDVARALDLKLRVTSTSVTKLKAMRDCVASDGRAHGLIQYHGATTGRDAGRLLQPQNFPRGKVEGGTDEDGNKIHPWEVLVPAIQSRDAGFVRALFDCPIDAVASALRHCIVPAPGKLLLAGDFATIEARITLALAGQWDRLKLITDGLDIYCDLASIVLGREVKKGDGTTDRQDVGKPTVLGCGFGMGPLKFHRKYMRRKPYELAEECVRIYREEWAPEVPKLWEGLFEASMKAVWDRVPSEYAGILYRMEGDWLTARLPSGRKLYYYNARMTRRAMPWDPDDIRPSWSYTAKKMGQIREIDAYGAMLVENAVQGLARDLLYDRALVAEAEGFPLVLTVHDEELHEVDESRADPKALQQIMEYRSRWVEELRIPVEAECWVGDRYRK